MAKTYAKLVTANGEYEMSHRQLDEMRMLLSASLATDTLPRADPPVFEPNYEDLKEWISQDFDKNRQTGTEYLD